MATSTGCLGGHFRSGHLWTVQNRHIPVAPELPGYRDIDFAEAIQSPHGDPAWALVDEHPIEFFSAPLTPEAERFLSERGKLAITFMPFVENPVPLVWDLQDAYSAPIPNLSSLVRPDPVLKIYRLEGGP